MKIVQFFENISYQTIFAIIATVFGLLFLFVTPPFEAPDEINHFFRAYQISNGGFWGQEQGETSGGFIPESLPVLANFMTRTLESQVPFHPDQKFDVSKFHKGFQMKLNPKNKVFITFPNTTQYSFVPYIPQVVGISFGRAVSHAPLVIYYLGCLGSLMFFVSAGYYLIKRVAEPYKELFFVILLLPTTIFIARAISADTVATLLSFGVFGYFLTQRYQKKTITKNNILLYIGILLLLGFAKSVYSVIAAGVLLIPFENSYSLFKNTIIRLGLILISFLGVIVTSLLSKPISIPARHDVFVNSSIQLNHVVHHPISFCIMAIEYVIATASRCVTQIVGVFGWNDAYLPTIGYIIGFTLIGLVVFKKTDNEGETFRWFETGIMFLITVGIIFAVVLFLFLTWSPAGRGIIEGMQGRYFLPIAPIILLVIRNIIPIRIKVPKIVIIGIPIILLALSVGVIMHRFY